MEKKHPFLRRTEHLWERCGCGRTSGRLVDEPPRRAAYYLLPPSFHSSIFPLSTQHHRLTQILRLMATGNGGKRHQMQGELIFVTAHHICGRLQFVFLPNIQFRGLAHVCWCLVKPRSSSCSVLLQLSDCLVLMISEHLTFTLTSH